MTSIGRRRSRSSAFAYLLLVAVAGCRTLLPAPEEESWTFVGQFRTESNVDLFVHDFEGAAGATIAHSLNQTYIVSWPTYVIIDEARQELASGIIWAGEDSVRLLPRPPGLRRMVAPISTGDGRGGLHLVWGDSPDSLSTRPTELWYSHFDGRLWTEREKLSDIEINFPSDKPVVLWTTSGRSPVVRMASDDLVFLTQTGHITMELAVFRRHEGLWSKTIVQTGRVIAPMYVGLLEVAPDELVLAGVAPNSPPGETDQNSVLASRSSDAGRTWSPLQMVHRSRDRPAHYLKLTQSPPSRATGGRSSIFIVWHRGIPQTDSVLAARSLDGGRTWEPLPGHPLPPNSMGMDAIARCDGSLEVAVRTEPTDTSKIAVTSSFVSAFGWQPMLARGLGAWKSVGTRTPAINRWPVFVRRGAEPPMMVLGTFRQRVVMPQRDSLIRDSVMAITGYASRRGVRRACEMELPPGAN